MHKQHESVSFVPQNIGSTFPNLNKIIMDGCNLRKIYRNDFRHLTNLQALFLDNNAIETVEANSFDDLTSLEIIDLDDNQITSLNEEIFAKCTNLRTISIHDNFLATLPAKIFRQNRQIVTIKLQNNEISHLSPTLIDGLSNLREILLRGNVCIKKNYQHNSIVSSFVVDMAENCRATTTSEIIVKGIKDNSLWIIILCVIVIISFMLRCVVKRIRRKEKNFDNPEYFEAEIVRRNSVNRFDDTAEHIYSEIDDESTYVVREIPQKFEENSGK
jgi:hypothetical protein